MQLRYPCLTWAPDHKFSAGYVGDSQVKDFSYSQSAPCLKLQDKPIPDAARIEDNLVNSLLVQYLPRPVVGVLKSLEQHRGIAGILDIQIRRFNGIVEKRLYLGIPQMSRGSTEAFSAFIKELADFFSRDGCHLIRGKSLFNLTQKLSVALHCAFPEGTLLVLFEKLYGFLNNHDDTSLWIMFCRGLHDFII